MASTLSEPQPIRPQQEEQKQRLPGHINQSLEDLKSSGKRPEEERAAARTKERWHIETYRLMRVTLVHWTLNESKIFTNSEEIPKFEVSIDNSNCSRFLHFRL